uniref:Carboxypeptidase n=1 Tax=Macrostomum lignano TaxID=282301 RepID=A0A1I8H7F0_9PLAT
WLRARKADPTKRRPASFCVQRAGPGCSSLRACCARTGLFASTTWPGWRDEPLRLESRRKRPVHRGSGWSGASATREQRHEDQRYSSGRRQLSGAEELPGEVPEYKGREMHISGESYGGVYVPTLAARVLTDKSINLRGILIGNSIDSWPLNSLSLIYFGYYHGRSDWLSVLGQLTSSCCNSCVGVRCDFYAGKSKPACADLLYRAERITDGLNIYNLYQPCYGGVPKSRRQRSLLNNLMFDHLEDSTMDVTSWTMMTLSRDSSQQRQTQQESPSPQQEDRLASIGEDPPCTNSTAITTYLNLPAARYALHVKDVGPYTICSNLDYTVEYNDMTPVYQKLLKSGRLRITLYNGDVDMACNFLQTEWFLQNLNQTVHKSAFEESRGTSTTRSRSPTWAGNLTYLTVRGSGHMVPEDKPQQAYVCCSRIT